VAAERGQLGVAEPLADAGGLAESGAAGDRVPLKGGLGGGREQQVALLDAVGSALEQPPRASDPAAALGGLAVDQEPDREPHRAAGGPGGVAEGEVDGEALEVVRGERTPPIGSREPLVRLGPRPALECLPAPPQCVRPGRHRSLVGVPAMPGILTFRTCNALQNGASLSTDVL
jgi:hypothetical protein